jgi:hypothetical protein
MLHFARNGDTHEIVSSIGNTQGDPAGGVWFNAGIPEAFLAKYFDDANGFVPPRRWRVRLHLLDCRVRAETLPNSFSPEGKVGPAEVPLAWALCGRCKCAGPGLVS